MTVHTPKLAASESAAATSAAENSWLAEDSQATQAPPTVEEARKFTDDAENRWLNLIIKASRAQWVQETFITPDTEQIAADADAAGFLHVIGGDGEHRAAVDRAGRKQTDFGFLAGAGFLTARWGRFRHADTIK